MENRLENDDAAAQMVNLLIPVQVHKSTSPHQLIPINVPTFKVRRLKQIGGKSNSQAIRRVAQLCFGMEIAVSYTWHGMRGKQSMKRLRIARCIEDALAGRGITNSEVATEIGNWLRHASDRHRKKLQDGEGQETQLLESIANVNGNVSL